MHPHTVQWSEDVIKADPFFGGSSEGGFQVVNPLGLWSRSSGVVKVLHGYGWSIMYTNIYIIPRRR